MSATERSEQYVREYFEQRDWTVDKLDTDNEEAADFRISDADRETRFLCEVKTIESAHANYPGNPLEWFSQQREEGRAQVEQWKKEEPNSKLILRPGEYEFLYGDPVEFAKRYRHRRRYTEYWFNRFADELSDDLRKSNVGGLPYRIRIDSQDMYIPSRNEKEGFIQWLQDEPQAIHRGTVSWRWNWRPFPDGKGGIYSTFYPIHRAIGLHDVEHEYQLMVEGPYSIQGLVVNVHGHGQLNLDAITRNVDKGVEQLNASAMREDDSLLPRIVALSVNESVGLRGQLYEHIAWLLEAHRDLSAIALLERIAADEPPDLDEGNDAWLRFLLTTDRITAFEVFHNSWLEEIRLLPLRVFGSESVQLFPLKHREESSN